MLKMYPVNGPLDSLFLHCRQVHDCYSCFTPLYFKFTIWSPLKTEFTGCFPPPVYGSHFPLALHVL